MQWVLDTGSGCGSGLVGSECGIVAMLKWLGLNARLSKVAASSTRPYGYDRTV